MPHALRPVLVALCALAPFAASLPAQAESPKPSPEMMKLAPMIGGWTGSGTLTEASAKTKWTASGGYRQVLGGFWIQEDFTIVFEGKPGKLVFRGYLGWDRERKTFVRASVDNGGEVQVHDFTLQPDGTMLQMMLQHQQGAPRAERSRTKIVGDSLTHTLEVLMGDGASTTIVEGRLERQDAEAPSVLDVKTTWMGAVPNESMQKLARMAGSYEAKSEMVTEPGVPAVKLKGVDTFRTVFGGTVLYMRTDFQFEGVSLKVELDAFWAWDSRKNCFVSFMVDNLGSLVQCEACFADEGKAMVSTWATTAEGQPMAGRMVIALDDQGRPLSSIEHMMQGTSAPFESFKATCTKK